MNFIIQFQYPIILSKPPKNQYLNPKKPTKPPLHPSTQKMPKMPIKNESVLNLLPVDPIKDSLIGFNSDILPDPIILHLIKRYSHLMIKNFYHILSQLTLIREYYLG